MAVEVRKFDSPDETRTPDKTRIDVVYMGDAKTARFASEPGWPWSACRVHQVDRRHG